LNKSRRGFPTAAFVIVHKSFIDYLCSLHYTLYKYISFETEAVQC
jgi:hypothetical protein